MQTALDKQRRPLLAIILCLLFMVACRPSSPNPTPSAATNIPVSTGAEDWERIQASGKLVVGTSADYAPFAFYTANFALDGFDVALARALGKQLNLAVEVKDFAFEGLLDALRLGQIDVAIGALSVTPAREQLVDFTRVYYVGEDAILARQDATISAIRQPQEMLNYRIGVQTGSVYATWLTSTLLDPGLLRPDHLIVYNDINRAITELRANQLDLVMLDAVPAQQFVQQGGVKVVGSGLNRQRLAIAVRKGSTTLQQQADGALGELQSVGVLAALAEQYLALPPAEVIEIPTAQPATPTPAIAQTPIATATPLPTATPNAPVPCVDGMAYVADLSYDDAGMSRPPTLNPGQQFTKSWRIRNAGTCPWLPTFALVYIGGNSVAAQMGGQAVSIGQTVGVNGVMDLSANLIAPPQPGIYQGVWQMMNDRGVPFGQRIWVGVQILGQPTPTPDPIANINFWAERTAIVPGDRALLYWNVANVRAVYVYELGQPWEPNSVVSQGSREVWPRITTIYELRVIRMDGSPELRQIRIDVTAPPPTPVPVAPIIYAFNADQKNIMIGSCVSLRWEVGGTITQLRLYRNGQLLMENAGQRQYNDCPNFGGNLDFRLEATNGRTTQYANQTVTVLVRQPR